MLQCFCLGKKSRTHSLSFGATHHPMLSPSGLLGGTPPTKQSTSRCYAPFLSMWMLVVALAE
eukprot:11608173-Prorocentrum_lima.AAC.1